MKEPLSLIALALIENVGPITIRNLIAGLGSPEAVFTASKAKLMQVPGVGEKTADIILKSSTLGKAENELKYCERMGIRPLGWMDKEYPNSLASFGDAPLVLFVKGDYKLDSRPQVAIVGTRSPTNYGLEMAAELAIGLADKGICVVSGLAYGIDISAHRACLSAKGCTVAVLGHGLDRIYPPEHRETAEEMGSSGLLVSELLSGVKPDAGNFPARNRIISGLSQATIVVEAGSTGGALITARFALEQGREVFAVPGLINNPFSAGCHQLIQEGAARLLTSIDDVLEALNFSLETIPQKPKKPKQLEMIFEDEEWKILHFLEAGDAEVDQIGNGTGIGPSRLLSLLLALEFKGAVKPLPGKRFSRLA